MTITDFAELDATIDELIRAGEGRTQAEWCPRGCRNSWHGLPKQGDCPGAWAEGPVLYLSRAEQVKMQKKMGDAWVQIKSTINEWEEIWADYFGEWPAIAQAEEDPPHPPPA
ncbi:hypothetical protein SEA_JONJAMES_98 [Gordonia Phage JonJames]|nr:hypothetical protein SEA_JONJAMES_98 [Gordonia Phage JonJames]